MRRYIAYVKYVFKHKLYVYQFARQLGLGFWQSAIHDLSKFRPDEFIPYARNFYAPDGTKQYSDLPEYSVAWLKHIHRNPHHWQHWLLNWDKGGSTPLKMPEKYAKEMVADWLGAGLAITGKVDVWSWYDNNQAVIKLHPETKEFVEELISDLMVGYVACKCALVNK